MYVLLIMSCKLFTCTDAEIVSVHPTMATCEQAMERKFPELEDGQATMCVENSEGERT